MCPGVDLASKNEYQDIPGGKDDRCVRVTTLPLSCAECLKILEPLPTRSPQATRPVVGLLLLYTIAHIQLKAVRNETFFQRIEEHFTHYKERF
jgi:hypothetical protein